MRSSYEMGSRSAHDHFRSARGAGGACRALTSGVVWVDGRRMGAEPPGRNREMRGEFAAIPEAEIKIVRTSRKCPFEVGDGRERSPEYVSSARLFGVIATGNGHRFEDAYARFHA